MSKSINNATQLKPVITRAVKALYGRDVQNIAILKAEQFPLFREPKQGWLIHAEFTDDCYQYAIQMDVQMSNGTITRAIELHRTPESK